MQKSESYLAAPEHQDCYDSLKKSYDIDKDFFFSYDVYSLKRDRKDKDKDEDPSAGSDRGLKKRKLSKDSVQSEEPVFEVANSDMPHDQEGNLGDNEDEPRNKTTSRRDWFKKPTPPQGPTDPDWNVGKTTQEGPTQKTMTIHVVLLPRQRPLSMNLPGIEDMVPNIWSPIKVAYDKYALWGISHWREQRKSFYAFARGMQSRGDVYSTKRILAVTHVSVMRKHRYGYLEEIVVRRADNALYRFKEGDFPRLRINDIEDMLLLVVQNRLSNLSGDDVADFAIALRMFTRSLVIQRRVEDLQLGVESYQKHINVTKPDTTRPDLRKRHPYTPYKDPQGFIYVDDYKRNRLMRSDELYKFSDGTLTRLLSSLEDITKNIDMEYLNIQVISFTMKMEILLEPTSNKLMVGRSLRIQRILKIEVKAAVQNSNSFVQQDALILSVIEQLKIQVVNCTQINLDNKSVNDTLTAELERYKEQVKVLKEGQNVDLRSNDNVSDSSAQSVEIDRLKQTLSEHLKEKESVMQIVTLLKNDFKKEESRNIDREIALEKKIKQLDNIVFKRDQSTQTVHVLTKPQFFYDHTTKQALGFQNPFYLKKAQQLEPKLTMDPMMLEKKVNTTPVDYAVLNQLSQDFETRFVPQTKLSAEQAFWS
ncbi:hypothetical protein Tco_0420936 [Tanacetum coccineum]